MCFNEKAPHVMVGLGTPVAWHSSSRRLLMMTFTSVLSSALYIIGGTEKTHTMYEKMVMKKNKQ